MVLTCLRSIPSNQQMVIAVIKRVLPQKELLTLDPNFISTIPEEVSRIILIFEPICFCNLFD